MRLNIRHYLILIIFCFGIAWLPGPAIAVVDLLYFIATPGSTSIVLSWETATEFDNAGFFVQRGLYAGGPFTTITPLIVSIGDPFTGHYYQYEDIDVEIGIQYYYVLQILNADSTSDFTTPVAAIIPAPTVTPTITPTRTQTLVISPTTTFTPTSLASATQMATSFLPTNTVTLTLAPTATTTRTPTSTLEPISITGVKFPAVTTTPSLTSVGDEGSESSPGEANVDVETSTSAGSRVLYIVGLVILLWFVLALFLFFVIRYISRDAKNNQ